MWRILHETTGGDIDMYYVAMICMDGVSKGGREKSSLNNVVIIFLVIVTKKATIFELLNKER